MDIRHQPFDGAFGDLLIDRLNSGGYGQFEFMVAFAKQSGVLRMKAALDSFRAGGGTVSAFVGIDMDGTSSDALGTLLSLTDELYVIHTESQLQTFHSKVFVLTSDTEVWATVGSNNLTYSGLWVSFETWATDVFTPVDSRALSLTQRFDGLRDLSNGIARKLESEAELDDLVDSGYVKSEFAINVAKRQQEKRRPRPAALFATIVPHASGPERDPGAGTSAPTARTGTTPSPVSLSTPPSVLAEWVGEVFWAESRAMTGAARNQLDLSKRGRVAHGDPEPAGYGAGPGQAVGSVAFFGLDPSAENTTRAVTINYQGVDYLNNLVYFPDSEGANGTWRIQLNGESGDGRRLDHSAGAGGFVQKVLAFQRIDSDYYALMVVGSDQLNELASASAFSAHNGGATSGKLYGVITIAE